MNDEETVIRVHKVSKDFSLPHQKVSTIKSAFTSVFQLILQQNSVETQHALENISFEVKKGEFFGIVGRNGSGKSTLLKILANIYQPTRGSLEVRGKVVPFIELGVGFNPELSGRDNVYLNGALLGFSKKEIEAMYHDIVEFAELEQFMDQKLKNYSSGMQVRLAFSMAIRANADILLIDEVLAVGDADFQRKCFNYFKQLKRDKKTVVFVSHDMSAVQQYCDRAMLIDNNRVIKIASADIISRQYNKLFIENDKVLFKSATSPSGEKRWGDGTATWQKVTVSSEKIYDDSSGVIEIVATGKAKQDIEFPIFGFSIKDSNFTQLLGTNTIRKNKKIKPIKANQTFSVTWKVNNVLNDGDHYIDCTIAHDQASFVSDRWPDAAHFTVRRIEDNPYPVYTDIEFSHFVEKDK